MRSLLLKIDSFIMVITTTTTILLQKLQYLLMFHKEEIKKSSWISLKYILNKAILKEELKTTYWYCSKRLIKCGCVIQTKRIYIGSIFLKLQIQPVIEALLLEITRHVNWSSHHLKKKKSFMWSWFVKFREVV
jgi:hypothetical protein